MMRRQGSKKRYYTRLLLWARLLERPSATRTSLMDINKRFFLFFGWNLFILLLLLVPCFSWTDFCNDFLFHPHTRLVLFSLECSSHQNDDTDKTGQDRRIFAVNLSCLCSRSLLRFCHAFVVGMFVFVTTASYSKSSYFNDTNEVIFLNYTRFPLCSFSGCLGTLLCTLCAQSSAILSQKSNKILCFKRMPTKREGYAVISRIMKDFRQKMKGKTFSFSTFAFSTSRVLSYSDIKHFTLCNSYSLHFDVWYVILVGKHLPHFLFSWSIKTKEIARLRRQRYWLLHSQRKRRHDVVEQHSLCKSLQRSSISG